MRTVIFSFRCSIRGVRWIVNIVQTLFTIVWAVSIIGAIRALLASVSVVAFITFGENRFKHQNRSPPFHIHNVYFIKDTPHNCAKTSRVIFGDPKFREKAQFKRMFAREINLVTQPSFDCEQGINSQVQTVCSNADAVFSVLGIVFCKNERFSLSRKTHVPLWNEPRISHVRLL